MQARERWRGDRNGYQSGERELSDAHFVDADISQPLPLIQSAYRVGDSCDDHRQGPSDTSTEASGGEVRQDQDHHAGEPNQNADVIQGARPGARDHPDNKHRCPKRGRCVENAGQPAGDALLTQGDRCPRHNAARDGQHGVRNDPALPAFSEERSTGSKHEHGQAAQPDAARINMSTVGLMSLSPTLIKRNEKPHTRARAAIAR